MQIFFSSHATVYGSHSAMFAFYWKQEYFFLHMYPQLLLKNLVCVFSFIPTLFIFPQNCFSQNLFCFSYFYRGRIFFFLTFVVLRGSYCFSQGELSLFFIELNCFVFSWFSIFSYLLFPMFTLYWVVFVNAWQKGGDLDEMWEFCLFCLGGEYKFFLMYLT